jgi:hypothetical protein
MPAPQDDFDFRVRQTYTRKSLSAMLEGDETTSFGWTSWGTRAV